MLWSVIRLIFKTSSVAPDFFYVFNLILSFSTCSQSFKKICTWELLGANVLREHMTRKINHSKNMLIYKVFQSRVKWRFSFCDVFFVPEIFEFSYYANLATDDVIGCASTVMWQKIKKISANNEAILLKLGRDVTP